MILGRVRIQDGLVILVKYLPVGDHFLVRLLEHLTIILMQDNTDDGGVRQLFRGYGKLRFDFFTSATWSYLSFH